MSVLEETKYLMKKYKIKANKSLGQNFLIDDTVIENIVGGASIGKDDLVIEIGPGLGSMTALLVEKAKKVICIELDKKMIFIYGKNGSGKTTFSRSNDLDKKYVFNEDFVYKNVYIINLVSLIKVNLKYKNNNLFTKLSFEILKGGFM